MSRGLTRRDLAAMAAIVFAGAAITIAFGERIGVNRGEGWDGTSYSAWARDFHGAMFERAVNAFQAHRVLPSAVIHYGLRALGISTAGDNVIHAFQIYNAALLLGCVLLYGRIARHLGWSRLTAWVGFVAMFGSFAVARNALYYPTLTDPSAFTIGLAAVWAFLETRTITLLVLTLLAGFTWQPLTPVCALFALLPRPGPPLPERDRRWGGRAALAVGALAAATALWALLVLPDWPTHGRDKWFKMIDTELRPLTMACVILYVALAFHALARAQLRQDAAGYLRLLLSRRGKTALVLAALCAIYLLRAWWGARVGKLPNPFVLRFLPPLLVLETLRGPLWNIVHHVVYWGPVVLLSIGRWRALVAHAARWGPAPMLVLAMTVAISIGTESRQLNHAMPLVIVLAIDATAGLWTVRRAIGFAALGVAWSKAWLEIGYDRVINSFEFPNQWYMMHIGPWASDAAYRAHLIAVAVTAVAMWLLLRRWRRPAASPAPPAPGAA